MGDKRSTSPPAKTKQNSRTVSKIPEGSQASMQTRYTSTARRTPSKVDLTALFLDSDIATTSLVSFKNPSS